MVVSDNVWSVREIRFAGRNEMLRFNNLVQMGGVGESDEFLPVHYDIDATFRFLGNVVDGNYTAVLDYKDIVQRDPSVRRKKRRKASMICLNLTPCVAIRMLLSVIRFISMRYVLFPCPPMKKTVSGLLLEA